MKIYIHFRVLMATILFSSTLFSQALTPHQIDSLVEKTMETFNVPGMAVAVIKDGKILQKKGYGIQSVKTNKPVNTETLFGVASNTKAFTTAGLAQLVDKGKIEWDTKVTDIIPTFRLYAPYVTEEFTIRDLMIHRSGLGLGAGDLMVFPAQNTTTLEEMIHNLRYLKPVSSFRSKFDYDNLLYIIGGEIIARVSGEKYEDYIEKHIFQPLQMKRATMDTQKIEKDDNRIDGHAPVDGELKITKRTFSPIGKPAAGIWASIDAMTKWVQTRLNYGKYGKHQEKRLFSEEQAQEMWSPQTLIPTSKGTYNTHFKAYGLGWFLQDVKGYLQVSHTGGLLGIVSQVTMIPDLNLGIIVLTNQQSGYAFHAITNSIKDAYLDVEGKNRIQQYNAIRLNREKEAHLKTEKIKQKIQEQLNNTTVQFDNQIVLGTYNDNWFGKVKINQLPDGTVRFKALKSPDLTGTMQFYKGTTYVVRWDDVSLKADAFVNFRLDTDGKAIGFKMEAISPLTDFSYDYQDLNFEKND